LIVAAMSAKQVLTGATSQMTERSINRTGHIERGSVNARRETDVSKEHHDRDGIPFTAPAKAVPVESRIALSGEKRGKIAQSSFEEGASSSTLYSIGTSRGTKSGQVGTPLTVLKLVPLFEAAVQAATDC
jgi:hypothetical protein